MNQRQEKLLENYIRRQVRKKLREEYNPKPGTYRLEMHIEEDGSAVIKSTDNSHRILSNLIGIGSRTTKKYGEYFGQNQLDFLFFTKDKKELFS